MQFRYQLVRSSPCWLMGPSSIPWPRSNTGWRKDQQTVMTYSDIEGTKSPAHAYTSETQPSFHARRMHTSRTPHIFFADLRHVVR